MAKKKKDEIVATIGLDGKIVKNTDKQNKNVVAEVDYEGNIRPYAPAPSVNNNRNNSSVSSSMNAQNDVFSKGTAFQNQQPSILEEDNSLDTSMTVKNNIENQISKNIVQGTFQRDIQDKTTNIEKNKSIIAPKPANSTKFDTSDIKYQDTGKTYGDYYYNDYAKLKDVPIYKDSKGKYYTFYNNKYEPLGTGITGSVMTSKEEEKKQLEEAKKNGYKEQKRTKTKEYKKAEKSFTKLKKEYNLTDEELNDFINNGNLSYKGLKFNIVTNSMMNAVHDADDYRKRIKEGKIKKYDDNAILSVEQLLDLETNDLTKKQRKEYTEDLIRQNKKNNSDKSNRINYGYDGTLSGTIKALGSTTNKVKDSLNTNIVEPANNIKDLYEYGKKQNDLSLEYYKKMEGENNNVKSKQREMDLYEKFNQDLITDKSWGAEAIRNANTQVESIKNQGISATAFGTVGSAIGTIINPGAGTIAGAKIGGSIGYTLGSIPYTYKLEAGNQYKTLVEMGVPENIAKKHSKRVGAINAAIESGENVVDLFTFNSGSGTKVITKQTVSDLVDEYGEKQVNSWLSKKIGDKAANMMVTSAKSYAQNIASESVEEMTQETTSIASERLASKESNINRNSSLKKDIARVLEAGSSAAISTAFTAPISSVSGSIATNTMNNIQSKIENKVVKSNVINNEIVKEINKSNLNISNEDALNIQRQVYQELDNNGVEIVNTQQNAPNLPTENAIEQQNVVNNINNQVNDNVQNNMPTIENNTQEKYSNIKPPTIIKYQATDNEKINSFRQSAVKEGMINSKKTTNAMNVIEKVIEDKNYNVKFDRTITDLNGKSVDGKININKNGEVEIALNPNSDRAVEFLLTHEVTHAIETKELRGIILDYANKNSEFKSALQDLQKTYGTTNVNDEVVADISGQVLGNQEFINSLSMQNTEQSRGFISKVYHSIQRLLNKLTTKGRYRNFVEDLETKWREAYRLATNETVQENLKNDKFHVSDKISTNIENVLHNIKERNPVKLRDYTPRILVENGIKDLPMYENPSHIRKNILTIEQAKNLGIKVNNNDHYHGLGKDIYIKAIDSLDNPRAIFKNKKNGDHVILTMVKDEKNNSIIVPIEVETTTNVNRLKIDTNRIKTVYGYDSINPNLNKYIKYNLKNDIFEKIYEKKERGTGNSTVASSFSDNNVPQFNKNVKSGTSTKYSMQSKENNTQELDNSSFSLKEKQLEIIKKNNPVEDDYHTWIRNIDDIKTLSETLEDSDWEGYDEFNPDLTRQDILEAIDNGEIMVYSSYPIEQGTFISPSKMEAESYSANGKVYSKKVSINDVAWIDPTQGQYAKVENEKYSQKSSTWQEHLEQNYKATGTRTYFDEMTNTTKKAIAPISNEVKKISNEIKELKKEISERKIPIAKEYQKNIINSNDYNNYFDNLGIPKYYEDSIDDKSLKNLSRNMSKELDLNRHQTKELEEIIKNAISNENINKQELFDNIKDKFSEKSIETKIDEIRDLKRDIANTKIRVPEEVKNSIADYYKLKQQNFRKVQLNSNEGLSIDSAYQELSDIYPEYFNDDILNDTDKLLSIIDAANLDSVYNEKYILPESEIQNVTNYIYDSLYEYRNSQKLKAANDEIKNLYKEEDARKTPRSNKEIPKDPTKESSYDVPERLTRKEVKKQLLEEMEITAEDLSVGDDIKALNFQLTDPIRVNEKVFGWKLGKKVNEATIEKTKHNEAERTRWLNKERDSIKELGIKARSKESAAVQKYGEGKYVDEYGNVVPYGDINLISEFPNVKTQEKIKKAAEILRNKYDSYLIQINNVLTSLGYDAIPQREDYMRHFQELTDVFSQTGIPFNLNDMQAEDLPTDINGLTEFNKPGKNWFASAQKRTGIKTTYDAITGIDGYLEGASNLIYHTADIQRYRALSGLIRDSFGKTKGFDNLEGLTDAQVKKRIKDIQSNKLSKYVAWLDEQANMLANKKGAIDRGVERFLGRRGYTFLNTIKKQVGSNMTGFNIRSAMTNFISSTIASSKTNKLAMVKGTISTIKNMFHNDGFINKSDFLTSRFGSDSLSAKFWQKASNAGQIFMNGSDYFTSNQIVRSKYYEGLQKGMTESEAIHYADDFGSRVMGDRSKGMMPEAFNSKTLGLFTQFQLETNNQWQYMIHDTKMDFQKNSAISGGMKAGATMLFQMGQLAAYSFFFNELFEKLTGSRAAFDPVDILKKLFGLGDDDDDDKSFEQRMKQANSELVDAIPFASLFGSGGRMPISDALAPLSKTYDYLTGKKDKYSGDISLKDVGEEYKTALPYYVLPTGYGQIKKTIKGLSMFSKDKDIKGSYTKSGNLKFPVADTISSRIQAGLFGQYASKEARNYFDGNYNGKTVDKRKLSMYQSLNIPIDEYWSITKDISNIKTKLEGKSTAIRQDKIFNYIDDLDISNTKKSILKKSIYKSYKEDDDKIKNYINNSKMSKTNKKSILKRLGLDK